MRACDIWGFSSNASYSRRDWSYYRCGGHGATLEHVGERKEDKPLSRFYVWDFYQRTGDFVLKCFIRLTPTGVLLSKIAEPKHDINDVLQIAKNIAVGNPQFVFTPTIYTQTAKN